MSLDEQHAMGVLAETLREHVVTLASEPRVPGSRHHGWCRRYIGEYLDHAGFTVTEEPFTEDGYAGVNIAAEYPLLSGNRQPLLIIAAHYDSVPGSPGADDNASAVAALLESAVFLSRYSDAQVPWRYRLQLLLDDCEENQGGGDTVGIRGSRWHMRELQRRRVPVAGVIALEMLGYASEESGSQRLPPGLEGRFPTTPDFIGVIGNTVSRRLVDAVEGGMRCVQGLPVETLLVPGNGEALPDTRRSSHSPGWDAGYRAVMVTDTSEFRNQHCHRATDTPGTLNYRFLAKVTRGIASTVIDILERGM